MVLEKVALEPEDSISDLGTAIESLVTKLVLWMGIILMV